MRRPASILRTTDGRRWVPKSAPSKFWVGFGTWMPDEQSLRIVGQPDTNSILVSAPEDPQIFSRWIEEWVACGAERG